MPPWQIPLLQVMPSGLGGGTLHSPVALLHLLPRCSHSLRRGQVTPTHKSGDVAVGGGLMDATATQT
jgi:hypothetical protein